MQKNIIKQLNIKQEDKKQDKQLAQWKQIILSKYKKNQKQKKNNKDLEKDHRNKLLATLAIIILRNTRFQKILKKKIEMMSNKERRIIKKRKRIRKENYKEIDTNRIIMRSHLIRGDQQIQ
ncbi:unnamed protein product [Paramecium sonneborni]|uniref:Uncharacterized protein n=1 Tax=Paramecium sonneborni TaxID=65129 RepID=A0A8S1R401_9CILI|nr:unnamed protein product [Paramecium sonneborni]